MTGYPTTKSSFKHWRDERVYYDEAHRLITSQGPATSIDFALKIIAILIGNSKAAEVASQLILPAGIANYSN